MARILLVDDNEDCRFAVREAIRLHSQHEVAEACNGAGTLKRMATEDFDLVLLDVQMPDLDGFEVCRRLRADERAHRVPVVFLTATQYQVESRLRGLELGAADFIVQPINNLELMARIASVLRSKAMADEVARHNFELVGKVNEGTRKLETLAYELRVERDALRETFDVIEDGLLLLDDSGQIQLENTAGRKLCADVSHAADGPTGSDAVGAEPSIQPSLQVLAREAIVKDATCDRNLSYAGRQLNARAYPAAGRRALVYVRDVTEERDIELRRLQSEKLASIGMLAAGVAHEINNPASFVLANTEALMGILRLLDEKLKTDGPKRRMGVGDLLFEAMTIVQESKEGMARIQRMVRDLQSFSRVDDDATAITDVNAALESSLTMLRNELRYRAIVERTLLATNPVRASAARLGQVFLNLIINAAHAMADGDLSRNRLIVRSFNDGEQVVIEVQDNGPGILPEIMPRIFESFFTTKPAGLGTGLGLPISREIVRSVGGELTVESEPGRGALFRVRLPALVGTTLERPKTHPGMHAMRRRHILAVDDEVLLLKAYRRMLIEHHDVETAQGAKEALRMLERNAKYDVVLCDLQMPETPGAELYRIVAERWPQLAKRFIFITGGAFSPEARRFLEESVVDCINKPFQLEEILSLIDTRVGVSA